MLKCVILYCIHIYCKFCLYTAFYLYTAYHFFQPHFIPGNNNPGNNNRRTSSGFTFQDTSIITALRDVGTPSVDERGSSPMENMENIVDKPVYPRAPEILPIAVGSIIETVHIYIYTFVKYSF